jgi:hypothetical protein
VRLRDEAAREQPSVQTENPLAACRTEVVECE